MTILLDDAQRTVLKYKPPAAGALIMCLLLTFVGGLAWRSTASAGWLAGTITLLGMSILVLLVLCLNYTLLTFDWEAAGVHKRVHQWNPLLKHDSDHWSIRNLAHWQVQQDGSFWSVGFARKREPFQELCSARSLPEALRIAQLLAGHVTKPLRLVTEFDSLECTASKHEPPRFHPALENQATIHPAFNQEGKVTIRFPMGHRKIGIKGARLHRWLFFLFEGVLCLAVFGIIAPHSQPVTPSVITLIVCMLFGMAGALCTWIALHDLTGCTRLRVETNQLEIRDNTLGFLDCSSIRLPLSEVQLALVARHGPNASLILLTNARAYHLGIGLPAQTLLLARNNLAQLHNMDHAYERRAVAL
jgi:protein-S-isoprenylcysteine O-methyltransferase Ste14